MAVTVSVCFPVDSGAVQVAAAPELAKVPPVAVHANERASPCAVAESRTWSPAATVVVLAVSASMPGGFERVTVWTVTDDDRVSAPLKAPPVSVTEQVTWKVPGPGVAHVSCSETDGRAGA